MAIRPYYIIIFIVAAKRAKNGELLYRRAANGDKMRSKEQ